MVFHNHDIFFGKCQFFFTHVMVEKNFQDHDISVGEVMIEKKLHEKNNHELHISI